LNIVMLLVFLWLAAPEARWTMAGQADGKLTAMQVSRGTDAVWLDNQTRFHIARECRRCRVQLDPKVRPVSFMAMPALDLACPGF